LNPWGFPGNSPPAVADSFPAVRRAEDPKTGFFSYDTAIEDNGAGCRQKGTTDRDEGGSQSVQIGPPLWRARSPVGLPGWAWNCVAETLDSTEGHCIMWLAPRRGRLLFEIIFSFCRATWARGGWGLRPLRIAPPRPSGFGGACSSGELWISSGRGTIRLEGWGQPTGHVSNARFFRGAAFSISRNTRGERHGSLRGRNRTFFRRGRVLARKDTGRFFFVCRHPKDASPLHRGDLSIAPRKAVPENGGGGDAKNLYVGGRWGTAQGTVGGVLRGFSAHGRWVPPAWLRG